MNKPVLLASFESSPEEELWYKKYDEIQGLYKGLILLLEERYRDQYVTIFLSLLEEISIKIAPDYKTDPNEKRKLQLCMAWCIIVGGTTDPSTSPIIDFEGENSIEAFLRKTIERERLAATLNKE